MSKPKLSKKIVGAVIALVFAIAASFGVVLNDDVKDAVTDVTCSTVLECVE